MRSALSFLPVLTPDSVQAQLKERAGLLEEEIGNLDMVLATMVPRIGRLVEVEFLRAMRRAELSWVLSFQDELQCGALQWNPHANHQPSDSCSGPPRGGSHDDSSGDFIESTPS